VTKKTTQAVARIHLGLQECLVLGNLNAQRDWMHAKDCVRAFWLMLQMDKPVDLVLSSDRTTSVRKFVEMTFQMIGMDIEWKGEGLYEIGFDKKTGRVVVRVSEKYFRPTEVDLLIGDSSRARALLNWRPEITLENMLEEMVHYDIKQEAAQSWKTAAGN
jgi:GDPmannose 4,6-dehydratase